MTLQEGKNGERLITLARRERDVKFPFTPSAIVLETPLEKHFCHIIPKTVFWTNVGKIVLIYFLKILPLI